MADQSDTKVAYPYMTAGQWYGVRAKLRQSLPNTVGVDWVMAALGTSEKGARNILPQLKAVGVLHADGRPNTDIVHDLRDDDAYPSACARIIEAIYPDDLHSAWNDPDEDPVKVASWFMRNARTGQATATNQAKLYLTLLKAELPSPEEAAKKAATKRTPSATTKKGAAPKVEKPTEQQPPANPVVQQQPPTPPAPPGNPLAPNLHLDVQIHISADASDTQIDTIFKSMAKHLYGRE